MRMSRKEFTSIAVLGCGLPMLLAMVWPRKTTHIQFEFGIDPTPGLMPGAPASERASPAGDVVNSADELARQAAATVAFIEETDTFSMHAVDHNTTVLSTTLPASEDEAYELFSSIRKQIVRVTDLATYFERMAEMVDRDTSSSLPVVLMLFTDGIDDGNAKLTQRRITAAAKRLGSHQRVAAVIVVGLVRETRPGWSELPQMLCPLGNRLHIIPAATMNSDSIATIIDAVRTKGDSK